MIKKSLNKAQQEAVEYTAGPLLIVAGAGTGKTTVITEKIAYLIEKNLARPEEIVALTFTEKAATEMQDRVDDRLQLPYSDIHISTFHTFCERLLGQYGLEIGLPTNFKLITDTDAWLLIREHLYDFDLTYFRPLGNPTKHIHEFLKHFSKCKDELVSSKEYLECAEGLELDADRTNAEEKDRLTELANAYHKYNQLLLDKGFLDFGDLIFYCVKLLRERPNILKKIQAKYKYILVDEFQDVNWAQYVLTQLLSEKSQLSVVGDDDQSIYAFRGASVSNILRFQEDFASTKHIVLNENYRSAQTILDTSYRSIQNNNPDRLEVKLKIDKQLKSQVEYPTAAVVHLHSLTIDDEVKNVVEEILRLKNENSETTWDDFAILARANSHVEPFIAGLQKAGIPYEFLSSVGLFHQPLVLDAINYFKVLDNYSESTALYRILRMPCLLLPESDMQKLTFFAKKKSLTYYEVLSSAQEFEFSVPGIEIATKFLSLLQSGLQESREEKPSIVLYHFLEKSGCLKYLTEEENKNNQEIIHQIYQLNQFFDLLKRYEESTPDAHVQGFLQQYNYTIESGDEGKMYQAVDTPDSVNIMTVHGSKGLEFKYVFIVNLVEERFPTRRRGDALELPASLVKEKMSEGDYHYQEERRLFYVAMTRAKERLYFTSSSSYGGVREKKLSRFLDELGFTALSSEIKTSPLEIMSLQKNVQSARPYILPKAFSFSQIKSYQTCPYQYKLAHIIKIPTKSNAHFSFGTSIHTTFQKFYERMQELNIKKQASLFDAETSELQDINIQVPSLQELLDIYKQNFIPDWYKDKFQKENYFKKGKEILTLFYQSQEGNWRVPISLESAFKIRIGDYTLRGRIDRIDQLPNGSLEIIDYKTGESKDKLTAEDKEQLLIYQIAAESLPQYRNLGTVEKLTFYYVNDNVQMSFVGKDKELEKLTEKLRETIAQIHSGNFAATPNPFVCDHCDFKDICEFRSL